MFSLKSFVFAAFCISSTILIADQSNAEDFTYLLWDNHTVATEEDLLADPLLILRTSKRCSTSDSLVEAYQQVAKLHYLVSNQLPIHKCSGSITLTGGGNLLNLNSGKTSFTITSENNDFYYAKPYFNLNNIGLYNQLWWQISTSPDFSSVPSTLEKISPFTRTITLTEFEETFLNNETVYYFRAKGELFGFWGAWSEPFAFTIVKPNPIENFHIECQDNHSATLCWESDDEDNTYLVFGSNSIDFIPSIYSSEQPMTIIEGEIVVSNFTDNFLGETSKNDFPIDNRLAYYRVIAKKNTSLSTPSKILPINDGLPAPECDLLQYEFNEAPLFLRKKLPEGYSWMQKKIAIKDKASTHYVQNPYVSEELWNMLSPYFLPEHFPEKRALDRIFSKRQVLSSMNSMIKSGFTIITQPKDKIVVAKHPNLKGYLIKAYTDDKEILEWYWWKKRIDGIRIIQEKIIQYGYEGIMKTPKKWIYPLPPEPSPKEGIVNRKNFILVVQEMDILDFKKNRNAYKTKMTPQILDAYYIVLTELLLIDSVYADNTPFCKDGKMAFVDTEHSLDRTRPVPLTKVASYLSPEMHQYWEQLIINGGPQR